MKIVNSFHILKTKDVKFEDAKDGSLASEFFCHTKDGSEFDITIKVRRYRNDASDDFEENYNIIAMFNRNGMDMSLIIHHSNQNVDSVVEAINAFIKYVGIPNSILT